MASARTPGHLPESNKSNAFKDPVQTFRGQTGYGLQYRALGSGSIEVTGGAAGTDTFLPTIGGVSIVAAAVEWTTSHSATAEDIADAINANRAANEAAGIYVYATVSSATVTVQQSKGGALGALATTVTANATTTDTDFSGDTNTWTEFVSGQTFDGNLYYELWWDPSDVPDTVDGAGNAVDLSEALLLDIQLYCDGQAWAYWMGQQRSASNVLIPGIPVATTAWKTIEWLGAGVPIIIKLASDAALHVQARYI